MSGSVRSAVVRLSADVSGLVAGYQKAKVATTDLAKTGLASAAEHRAALLKLGNQAGVMGAAVGAGVLFATQRFADFDQEMSHVQAATGETGASMDQLRSLALDLGAKSQFSATEAAQGITNLAKAGVSTADIMGGGLKGSLDLAAAGELSVASAAEDTATALTQFHLSGSQATHVADLLAASANMAQGEVSDMATALNYAGIPAANLGVSIEQTTGTLALFAKNGLIGEQAGTTLRGMLSSLTSPSAQARKEMEALGITVFDAQGKFLGLDGVAGQLQGKMAGLTQEERANALGRIFGNAQIQGANILYREGAGAVDKWTAGINKSGYAAQNAATKTDNLKGDIERLGGALDSLLITSASGGNGPLRSLVQDLTHVIDAASKLPGPVKSAAFSLGALSAVSLGGIFVGTRIVTGINDTRKALDELGWSSDKLPPKLGAVASAVGKIGAALVIASVADQAFSLSTTTDEIQRVTSVLDASGGDSLPKQIDATMAKIAELQKTLPSVSTLGGPVPLKIPLGITTLYPTDQAAKTAELIDGLKNHLADLQAQLEANQVGAGDLGGSFGLLGDLLGETIPPLGGVADAAGSTEDGVNGVADAAGTATQKLQVFKGALDEINGFLDKREAWRNYQQSIDDWKKSMKDTGATSRQTLGDMDAMTRNILTVAQGMKAASRVQFLTGQIHMLEEMAHKSPAAARALGPIIDHLYQAAAAAAHASGEQKKLITQYHLTPAQAATVIKQINMGKSQDDIRSLLKQYGLTPAQIKTAVALLGTASAEAELARLTRARTVEIHTVMSGHVSTAGGRAAGGPVEAGKSYWVGETGIERFTPTVPGYITPHHQLAPVNATPAAAGRDGSGDGGPVQIEGRVTIPGLGKGWLEGTMRTIARQELNDASDFATAMAGGSR